MHVPFSSEDFPTRVIPGQCAFVGWNDPRNVGTSSVLFAKNERPIPVEFVRDVQRMAWEGCYECEWRAGDVLLLDNAIRSREIERYWCACSQLDDALGVGGLRDALVGTGVGGKLGSDRQLHARRDLGEVGERGR